MDTYIPNLYNGDKTRLVAVEALTHGEVDLFRRVGHGAESTVVKEKAAFRPWLLVAGPDLAAALPGACGMQELQGDGAMRARVFFPDTNAYKEALVFLKKLTGKTPSAPLAPYRVYSDLSQQAMFSLGLRLFQEMDFQDLRRLQFDIECNNSLPGTFCDAMRADDYITLVSLKDNHGYEECLSLNDFDGEAALLEAFVQRIAQRDPDVLEGHNCFNFDLDYLEKRCRRHNVRFGLGRNGCPPASHASRFNVAERIVNYKRYDIFGRHVVDTYHLVQLGDVAKRELDSYGLKYCAKHFGIARKDRVYVAGDEITQTFKDNPEKLKEYCLDDVRETDGLSRLFSPSYFYQTRLLPLSYQNCILRGNATRIDALLCAKYLEAGAALPSPQAPTAYAGALTEAVSTGLFKNVWHIDVRSLYPSIILAHRLTPATDHLGLFCGLLEKLRTFRLQAKDSMRKAATEGEREYYSALQNSFKILINSFYGYLGFAQGTFNDFNLAEKVTETGRGILAGMRASLEERGATIVEMDTDGIYFCPPQDHAGDTDALRMEIQRELPAGIEVELDGTYQAMLSYKSKNYALLENDGRISLHGAALRSRGMETFLRRLIPLAIEALLKDNRAEAERLFQEYEEALASHAFPLRDFLQRETLNMTVEAYAEKLASGKGRRSAVYEVASRDKSKKYRAGDTLKFYVTGNKKSVSVTEAAKAESEIDEALRDENVPYYMAKLQALKKNLLELME